MNQEVLEKLIAQRLSPKALHAIFAKPIGQAITQVRVEEAAHDLMPFSDGADPFALRLNTVFEAGAHGALAEQLDQILKDGLPAPSPIDGESICYLAAIYADVAVKDVGQFCQVLHTAVQNGVAVIASQPVTLTLLSPQIFFPIDGALAVQKQGESRAWESLVVGKTVWASNHVTIIVDSIVPAKMPTFCKVRLRMHMAGLPDPCENAFASFKSLVKTMRWLFPHSPSPTVFQESLMPAMESIFDVYLANTARSLRKKSLRSRVRRALDLLTVASEAKNEAAAAALCIAAVDTLVASKVDIAKSIQTRSSRILEPEAASRSLAEAWIAKAWRHRNKFFHEGEFGIGERLLSESKRLAAGLLLALLQQAESAGGDDADSFFEAVDQHERDGYVLCVRGSALFRTGWH